MTDAAKLLAALRAALPYVEKVAATKPTEPARAQRQRQAATDAAGIRDLIAVAANLPPALPDAPAEAWDEYDAKVILAFLREADARIEASPGNYPGKAKEGALCLSWLRARVGRVTRGVRT